MRVLYTYKILFIGGPGTGKSSTLEALKKSGHCCFDEISRRVTLEAQKNGIDQLFLKNPLLFSEKLLEGRIMQFKKAAASSEKYCFIDRGIPDVGAYMDYKNEPIPKAFTEADKTYRYDMVFFFPLWKDIYISDNERYESFEEAEKIQGYLKQAYHHLGYALVEIPKASIAERVVFILKKMDYANVK